jgi:hypothetical protein
VRKIFIVISFKGFLTFKLLRVSIGIYSAL